MTNIKANALLRGQSLLLLACVWGLAGCSHSASEGANKLDAALAHAVDADSNDDVHSAVMAVDAPRYGLQHASAAGVAHKDAAMTVDTAFFSASVGKLFVAAAVLSLSKSGAIELDAPFSRYVDFSEVRGLPVAGGDRALAEVTVRQLLSHRSGLPDYFADVSADGAPHVADLMVAEPDRVFTRDDLLSYTRAHFAPVGAPGKVFHYANTNYDLLGMVLERVTGAARYTAVVREQVIAPLGLEHTWYHDVEPAPMLADGRAFPTADAYLGGVNVTGFASLSADQAGGGLMTTVADLQRFMRGLVAGTPVALSDFGDFTLDAMHGGIDVGLALWRIRPAGVFFALGGMPDMVGHSGSTGVWAYYASDIDAVFVGAASASSWQEKHIEFLLAEVVPAVIGTTPVAQD